MSVRDSVCDRLGSGFLAVATELSREHSEGDLRIATTDTHTMRDAGDIIPPSDEQDRRTKTTTNKLKFTSPQFFVNTQKVYFAHHHGSIMHSHLGGDAGDAR